MPITKITANLIDANNERLSSLADPVVGSDAATKQYVDTAVGGVSGLRNVSEDITPTLGGDLDGLGVYRVSNLAEPVLLHQAATKNYVDSQLSGIGTGISNVVEDITPQLGGNLDAQSTYQINNLQDPVLLQQAATKNYVDSQIAGVGGGGGGADTNAVDMTLNADGIAGQATQVATSGVDVVNGGGLTWVNPANANHPNTSWGYNDHHLLEQHPTSSDKFLSMIATDGKLIATLGTFDPVTNDVSWSAAVEETGGVPASIGTSDAFAVAVDPNANVDGDHLFLVAYENGTSSDAVLRAGKIKANDTVEWGNAIAVSGTSTTNGKFKYAIDFCNDATNKHIFGFVCCDTSQYPTLFVGSIDPSTTTITNNNIGNVHAGSCNSVDIEFSPANSADTAICVVALGINGISRAASCKLNNFASLTDVTINTTQIPYWSTAHVLYVNWDADGSGNLYFSGYGDDESSDTYTNQIVFITPSDVTLGTDSVLSVWRDGAKHVLAETNTPSLNASYYHILKPKFVRSNEMLVGYMETDNWPQQYTYKKIDFAFNTSSTVYTESLAITSDTGYYGLAMRNMALTSKGVVSAGRDYNDYWVVNEPTAYTNLDSAMTHGVLTATGLTGQTKSVQWDGVYTTTGLTAGSNYYVQPDGTITTDSSGVVIGVALSTTQLLLNGGN